MPIRALELLPGRDKRLPAGVRRLPGLPGPARRATGVSDAGGFHRALIGPDRHPAQAIEKVHRYHERFGHSVLHLHADAGGLTDAQHRASLELFQSDIAPVLRREIPDPPWGWSGGPAGDDTVPARARDIPGRQLSPGTT